MTDVPFDQANAEFEETTEEPRVESASLRARLILSVCALVLIVAVLAEFATGALVLELDEVAVNLTAASAPEDLPNTIALRPREDFGMADERPLFVKTRRPPAVEMDTTATPTLSVKLVGTLLTPELNVAIIRRRDGSETSLREGEALEGWTLTEVLVDRATFENNGRTALLEVTQPWER